MGSAGNRGHTAFDAERAEWAQSTQRRNFLILLRFDEFLCALCAPLCAVCGKKSARNKRHLIGWGAVKQATFINVRRGYHSALTLVRCTGHESEEPAIHRFRRQLAKHRG
jgi:hypothetical protein